MKLFLYSILFCLTMSVGVFGQKMQSAQAETFYYQQMDNRNGLSNSAVNIVLQDKDQLVWVGTWDGLNMYDGTDFRIFNYNNDTQSGSIGNNVIQDIKEDLDYNVWISTIGGITRFKKSTGTFYRYFYNQNKKNRIAEKEYEVAVTGNGQVFCYSKSGGLSHFDEKQDKFLPMNLPLNGRKVIKVEGDQQNRLWLMLDNGDLILAKIDSSAITLVKQFPGHRLYKSFFLINGKVLLARNNGLDELNSNDQIKPLIGQTDGVKAIAWYHNNYVIAWENQGISTFDPNFRPSAFMTTEVRQLAATRVTTLAVNKGQVLWVGTDGNGLIKIYPRLNHFGLINTANGYALSNPVRAFSETNGELWIGTKGKGILKINNFWAANPVDQRKENINTGNGLPNNSVFSLKKGLDNVMYIGTDGQGINIYDLQKKKIIPWSSIKGTTKLPVFSSVYAILQDPDSSLWLGTSGSGLIHLSLSRTENGEFSVKNFKQYLSADATGPANDIIYALANGQDNRLWIACRYGGLSVLDKKSGQFKTFKASAYQQSLSNNDVLSLYRDHKNNLWIGTSYGLNRLTPEESKKTQPIFRKFIMADGLPNNTIHAIEEAADGDIWVSTNKGLARLNAENLAIASFRESDGLQSNEFSDGAVWRSATGHIFFGGIYGFNYFMPQTIKGNTQQPNLLVSMLQMGGQTLNPNRLQILSTSPGDIPAYTLERKSNFFQISLKSMSYLNPEKNEFSYKLEGLDKNWNYSGAMGNVMYNNIPPGKYRMMVRWSNGEGIWTEGIEVFNLKVEQYLWLTYPAIALYLLIILASAYAFHAYRKNKLQMRYRLAMEHLMREKDENEHQQRINFFTNIAHEIQTPLTMIMGSVEHFLQSRKNELFRNKENNYFLSIVHQHTVRLTYLVQQLLEFRKAEAGYLKRNDDYVDLTKMLNGLAELFRPQSEKSVRPYNIRVQDGIAGFIDKDKFEKILYNLLSNAFKHSDITDEVTFEAIYTEKDHLLKIQVSNSGCTLDPQDLDHLFDRFFVTNEQKQKKFSTGIGLAFTKELVNLIGARINVTIEQNWIHFTLLIHLEAIAVAGKEDEVITSAPSYVYESLVKQFEQPSAEHENKNSLIDELHQRAEHSILLVEDEPELRYLIRNVLKEQYIIYEAGNGTEALAFLKKTIPDLIISDVMMPDMDGLQLCAEVKNTPATAQVPFIILSARGSVENKAEGYEVGADAYIPKPFHINYLHVRIRKLLDYKLKMEHLIKDQHISTQFMDADIEDTDKKFLESLLKVIENNLNEPELNAAMLEDALAISKMQLYRKLKSLAGMTPAEFIKRIRLKHAADMLLASQFTVSEIFYRTGFNNRSYFFREFKKIYQCAPNEYRQRQFEAYTPIL
ncbi:hybrid sensor histidine kinase/response regulator transcription factor [Pedobacter duraquae]|uniref:histidine kinase n=1 Tax=Pedobacter duraquae TaxID=425511 RepID=A0A4R6IGR4_9SPHI|nr:hybrid sensor histidine kinase/response regulator transcription factor [Pedobacter duraquae]TDO20155.1 signal transduction histidine kinase [Pedobacter duraquae]